MDLQKNGRYLTLLESLTDEELAQVYRRLGGSGGATERSQIEANMVHFFSQKLVEQLIRAFLPNAQRRYIISEELSENTNVTYDNELFKSLKITNKSELLRWLVRNHPDRGGDNDLYVKVLGVFKTFKQ